MELAAARAYWLGQRLIVAGDGGIADAYATALGAQGCEIAQLDVNDVTLAGLAAARAELREART